MYNIYIYTIYIYVYIPALTLVSGSASRGALGKTKADRGRERMQIKQSKVKQNRATYRKSKHVGNLELEFAGFGDLWICCLGEFGNRGIWDWGNCGRRVGDDELGDDELGDDELAVVWQAARRGEGWCHRLCAASRSHRPETITDYGFRILPTNRQQTTTKPRVASKCLFLPLFYASGRRCRLVSGPRETQRPTGTSNDQTTKRPNCQTPKRPNDQTTKRPSDQTTKRPNDQITKILKSANPQK